MPDLLQSVRSYYNGYEFGGVEIYNPWSILNFLANSEPQLIPYWVSTSSNFLIQEQLRHHGLVVQQDMQTSIRAWSFVRADDYSENRYSIEIP